MEPGCGSAATVALPAGRLSVTQPTSQRDLALVAIGLGFLAVSLMVLSYTFNATLLHALGQAYVDAGSEAEGAALLGTLTSLICWMRGLNQMSSTSWNNCSSFRLFTLPPDR